MMRLRQQPNKKARESTIALINIVFLMLIFFLIAGTITPPIDSSINPITANIEENADLEDLLSARADGELYYRSVKTDPASYFSNLLKTEETSTKNIRLIVDQKLEATKLVEIINELKIAGASSIRLITKSGLK